MLVYDIIIDEAGSVLTSMGGGSAQSVYRSSVLIDSSWGLKLVWGWGRQWRKRRSLSRDSTRTASGIVSENFWPACKCFAECKGMPPKNL